MTERVADILGVKPEEVWAAGRYRRIVEASSLLCYLAVRELGISMSSLTQNLKISAPAVSKSVIRGKKPASKKIRCSPYNKSIS